MPVSSRSVTGAVLAFAVAASCLSAFASFVGAAPEPAPVPKRWQLDVKPGPLRVAVVETADAGPAAYFYLTYTVTNNSREDIFFAPTFELALDDGSLVRSGRDIPRAAVAELLRKLENPFLEDEISILSTLGQGEENAREGLVVWPATSLGADEIMVFASGMSGETRRITKPDTGEEVTLRKTLMLRYATPGDIRTDNTPLERVEQRWILR